MSLSSFVSLKASSTLYTATTAAGTEENWQHNMFCGATMQWWKKYLNTDTTMQMLYRLGLCIFLRCNQQNAHEIST